jgi:hypothetical protein
VGVHFQLVTDLEGELVDNCRRYYRGLFKLLEDVYGQKAKDLKVRVDFIRRMLEETGGTEANLEEFIDIVPVWSRDNQ